MTPKNSIQKLETRRIIKITNPAEYLQLLDNLEPLWKDENLDRGHVFPINKDSLAQIANAQLLTWEYHIWSNSSLDSVIIFHSGWNILFGKTVFQEVLWLSKSHCGIKLLKTALSFARAQKYDLLMMGSADKMNNPKLTRLYNKIKLQKDGEIWMGKI